MSQTFSPAVQAKDPPGGSTSVCVTLVLTLILAIAGCKVRIEVPEGGRVESESGVFNCDSGQTCDIDVVDMLFDETFEAIPQDGYYFRKWDGGDRSLCGSTYKPCRINSSEFLGNPTLEKVLNSDVVYTLRPQFVWGECEPSSITQWDSWRESEVRIEGQKCTVPDMAEPVYQGVVRFYVNDVLESFESYDQDRKEGEARRWGYDDDGKYYLQVTWYSNGGHDGTQIQYDKQGRLEGLYQWKDERLHGKSIWNDYTWTEGWEYLRVYDPNAGIKISTDNYVNGKLNGTSTIHYPNGDWENTDWVNGVQHGIHEFGKRDWFGWCQGWRYVYTVVNGKVTEGAAYYWYSCGDDGSIVEPVQQLSETWTCNFVKGVVDEDQCFKHKPDWRAPWLE